MQQVTRTGVVEVTTLLLPGEGVCRVGGGKSIWMVLIASTVIISYENLVCACLAYRPLFLLKTELVVFSTHSPYLSGGAGPPPALLQTIRVRMVVWGRARQARGTVIRWGRARQAKGTVIRWEQARQAKGTAVRDLCRNSWERDLLRWAGIKAGMTGDHRCHHLDMVCLSTKIKWGQPLRGRGEEGLGFWGLRMQPRLK